MLRNLLHSHALKYFAEGCTLFFQAPLKRTDVHVERMGDLADRRPARRHQKAYGLFDFFPHATVTRIDERPEQLARMARQRGIRHREPAIEVGALDHDAVEIRTELQRAVEKAIVDRAVGHWALVAEADALRAPVAHHDRSAHLVEHAEREIAYLPDNLRLTERNMFAHERNLLMFFHLQRQN